MFHFHLFTMECVVKKCVDKTWHFVIEVREGAPGWADDDTYQSRNFDSFDDCYIEYINFSPAKHWEHLRRVHNEYIVYKCGEDTTNNKAILGAIYYRTNQIVEDLGITEEQFDTLIDKLKIS